MVLFITVEGTIVTVNIDRAVKLFTACYKCQNTRYWDNSYYKRRRLFACHSLPWRESRAIKPSLRFTNSSN